MPQKKKLLNLKLRLRGRKLKQLPRNARRWKNILMN